jgi:hypothetical protein
LHFLRGEKKAESLNNRDGVGAAVQTGHHPRSAVVDGPHHVYLNVLFRAIPLVDAHSVYPDRNIEADDI